MAYERKDYRGNAAATTLTSGIDASQTTIAVDDATNWPGDNSLPFVISIGRGTATEETILCESRSGTTLTVRTSTGRGHDDTTAQAHSSGATVEHVMDAETLDQVNRLANLLESKGSIVAFNGTNPVELATGASDDTDDGHVLQLDWSEATGLTFGRLVTVLAQAGAPTVAGYVRLWYDTANRQLRPSDGSSWTTPVQVPSFSNATTRDAYFSSPVRGHMAHRQDYDLVEYYNGTSWKPASTPRFANTTARDAYYSTPADGDEAYITASHEKHLYREDEWILVSQKIVVSANAPSSPHNGDLWFQPVD